jgi:hypothetical protein
MCRGRLTASVYSGAWRSLPEPLCLDLSELSAVAPLLLTAGAGGLGWWRIRAGELKRTQVGVELQQAYRYHALHVAVQERRLELVLSRFRSAGIDPLVAKGWAVARLYAEPGLRPYADFDLCIRPELYEAAQATLEHPDGPGGNVDLHRGLHRQWSGSAFSLLDDRALDDLYARSELAQVGEVGVRILGPEDHLRLLCLHFLCHGGWRPLWLCDVAAALESRPPQFDWELCLGGDQGRGRWVACTIALAHRLLGARLEGVPAAVLTGRVPRWLTRTVLRQWGEEYRHRVPISDMLRRNVSAFRDLPDHWPNGIEATMDVGGPPDEGPRLPFQVAAVVKRTADFVRARLSRSETSI